MALGRKRKPMRVIHEDSDTIEFLDEAAMTFMALTVHRLNGALTESGVDDAALRQEVCARFLFEFAYHHDAGWLSQGRQKLFPLVAFAKRQDPKEDENLGEIAEIHVPTPASSWHEYAHGVVSQYFEEAAESVDDISFGSYSEES
jgi:hypothetical protein